MFLARNTFDPDTLTWSSPFTVPTHETDISMGQLVTKALSDFPDKIGQVCHQDGHKMKNSELLLDSIRVASNLRDLGIKEGDIIGLVSGNGRNLASVVFGALFLGAPVHSLDPLFELDHVIHMFRITQPQLVLCDEFNFEMVKKALEVLENTAPIYVFANKLDGGLKEERRSTVEEFLRSHPEEQDFKLPTLTTDLESLPAFIICTSGTTGLPKSVSISHGALAFQAWDGVSHLEMSLSFGTLNWASGISALLLSTYSNMTRVIVNQKFDPHLCLEVIQTHQVDFLICTPTQMQLMMVDDFEESSVASLKFVICSGGILPEAAAKRFGRPILDRYGLTESNFSGSNNGQLSVGNVAKVIDDEGNKLGAGELGEVCLRIPFKYLGYYNNPEATKDLFRDGFIHTGDLGLFNAEGFLRVVDRKKDIFKYNYYQINPTEIENELKKIPGVALACAVGVPHFIYRYLPAVAIIRTSDSELAEKEVHQYAMDHLPHYKWLRGGVFFFESLPVTSTGKVLRRKVTEMVKDLFEKEGHVKFDYPVEYKIRR